jgi:hypothetical protein
LGGEVLNFEQLINEDDDDEYNHYLDKEDSNNIAANGINTT